MAKAKAPRHLARPNEVAGGQLVDRVQRVLIVDTRRGHRQVELERVAGHRSGFRKAAGAPAEAVELGHDRRHHGRGHFAPVASAVIPAAPARQLQQVERVAPAGAVELLQLGGPRGVHQLSGGRRSEWAEVDTTHRVAADSGGRDGGLEPAVGLAGAKRPCHQHRRLRRTPEKVGNEFDGGPVGPVQVLEHEDQGLGPGEPLDQIAHGMVRAEALGRGCRTRRGLLERTQGGENAGDLRNVLRGQAAEGSRLERPQVLVESVHDEPERQLLLELGRAPPQREAAALFGAAGQLVEQRGLPNARLAHDEGHARCTRDRLLEQLPGHFLLVLSAHQARCGRRHAKSGGAAYPTRCDQDRGVAPMSEALR